MGLLVVILSVSLEMVFFCQSSKNKQRQTERKQTSKQKKKEKKNHFKAFYVQIQPMSIVLCFFWKYFDVAVVCSLKFLLHVAGEKQPPLTGTKCLAPWIWILIGLQGKAENTQTQRKQSAIITFRE